MVMIKMCSTPRPDLYTFQQAIEDSFEAGRLSNFGPCYVELVDYLKDFLEVPDDKDLVLVSSGFTALVAAYEVLSCYRLAVPVYTFEATRSAQIARKWNVEYCDVSLETGCLDIEHLQVQDVDSVVATAALSNIPNMKALYDWCKDNNKKFIVDGAATFGTKIDYHFCDAYVYSFHATKTFGIGEGGAVVCSKGLAKEIRRYINFGFNKKRITNRNDGINGKINEYACAIGLSIMDDMEYNIQDRLSNAAIYKKELGDFVLKEYQDNVVYQTFPIFLPNEKMAKHVRNILTKNDIENIQYYRPLVGNETIYYKNAQTLYKTNICLPVHNNVSATQIEFISHLINTSI